MSRIEAWKDLGEGDVDCLGGIEAIGQDGVPRGEESGTLELLSSCISFWLR